MERGKFVPTRPFSLALKARREELALQGGRTTSTQRAGKRDREHQQWVDANAERPGKRGSLMPPEAVSLSLANTNMGTNEVSDLRGKRLGSLIPHIQPSSIGSQHGGSLFEDVYYLFDD